MHHYFCLPSSGQGRLWTAGGQIRPVLMQIWAYNIAQHYSVRAWHFVNGIVLTTFPLGLIPTSTVYRPCTKILSSHWSAIVVLYSDKRSTIYTFLFSLRHRCSADCAGTKATVDLLKLPMSMTVRDSCGFAKSLYGREWAGGVHLSPGIGRLNVLYTAT